MERKENLLYEMKNLMKTLEKYLKILDAGEIDETAYQQLEADKFSVQLALRYYFDEDYFNKPKRVTMLIPYKE